MIPETSLDVYHWPYLDAREARALLGEGLIQAIRGEGGEVLYDVASLERFLEETMV